MKHFYLGDYTNALLVFAKLEPYYPSSDIKLFRGFIYLKQGKNDAALKELNPIAGETSDKFLAFFGRAEVFRHKRLYDEALNDYNRALKSDFDFQKPISGAASFISNAATFCGKTKTNISPKFHTKMLSKILKRSSKLISIGQLPKHIFTAQKFTKHSATTQKPKKIGKNMKNYQ